MTVKVDASRLAVAARPWLAHYDPGVPTTLARYPERTLVDVVRDTAAERPGHPALLFKGRRVSFADLHATSDAFAAGLRAAGVQQGDRVALLLPNSPQAIIAQFGAWKAGAIVVPLNPLYTEPELKQAISAVDVRAIVTLTPFYRKVKAIQPGTGIRIVVATNIKEYLPPLARSPHSSTR